MLLEVESMRYAVVSCYIRHVREVVQVRDVLHLGRYHILWMVVLKCFIATIIVLT